MSPDHGLQLVTGPTAEPVPLGVARAHCKIDGSDDDAVLTTYILAARTYVERITGRALMTQTWRMTVDEFPEYSLELPLSPVASVSSVTYLDAAGATQTVSAATYVVDTSSVPARLALADGAAWPTPAVRPGAVSITFVAGGTLAEVPEPLRQAIVLLVAHWHANREAVNVGNIVTSVPLAFDALVAAYRVHWL